MLLFFFVAIVLINDKRSATVLNDGSIGFIEILSIYFICIVTFRVFFAFLFALKWFYRSMCVKKYNVKQNDLHQRWLKIKNNKDRWDDSSDDENMMELID